MGAREILHRVRQAGRAGLERCGFGLARAGAPAGAPGSAWCDVLARGFDATHYRAAAERVLAGRFDVFALKSAALGFPPEWNRDPKTGTRAPLSFGKTLNYRDERIVGDIKYLWEPNRHAELVTLAQAWHLTGEARHAEGCRTLLDSWFAQCPYPLGANWTSSLEHAVRLVNWAVAWHLLHGTAREGGMPAPPRDAAFRQRWLDSIYQHCHFISGHLSRYSSANNHLLGELMGLFVASVTWPMWPASRRWRERAAGEFEAEALKQNGEDGVNREQAVWYQHEVADMMLLVGLFGRANGVEFSAAYWQRLERMLEFIAGVMDVGGHVPMFGDADDGAMVRFGRDGGNPYRSLLATGAVLFGRGDFKAKGGCFDDKSRWLLGDAEAQTFERLQVPEGRELSKDFAQGGYSVLGDRLGEADETRVVADAGPLGYLSIAAHGHADALALTLSVDGREILIDPGTYAYHTRKKWRDYFRGTSAHNTVRVDGVDQSVSGGNFLWTRHARAARERFKSTPECDTWVGSHDGYLRLDDPVLHRRTIEFDKKARLIWVTDRVECRRKHHIELFWHAAEDCVAVTDGAAVGLRRDEVEMVLSMPGWDWRAEIVCGREDPPLGWVSRRFDEKGPSCTVVWAGDIVGTKDLVTLIRITRGSA
ncbi:MAG: alginate lyase family protein [Betaproteobacteria bacterium]|nr:alginate lyase family protein [Betaproteobacteria bacterium]